MATSKSLREKRKKMGLSQTELAGLLGVSRPTLAKIEKNERPLNKVETEKLKDIFESFELDHQTQGDIRINIPAGNINKFKQVLLYILEKVGAKPNVGMTVVYKLLYFIDFNYYEKYETQLMGLTYFKNTHGPTPREFKKVVDEMKKSGELVEVGSKSFAYDQKKFLPRLKSDLSVISGQELEVIDNVLDKYADRTAKQLSLMTHRDMPWKATKHGENLDYELAFYRPDEFSVREYEEL
ncbi:MAG: type II toxin-antitoxin system antitoxin SocA domain-containing protein [Candidatus Paceibacterota bacterium]